MLASILEEGNLGGLPRRKYISSRTIYYNVHKIIANNEVMLQEPIKRSGLIHDCDSIGYR
jgi:hypothetical protein